MRVRISVMLLSFNLIGLAVLLRVSGSDNRHHEFESAAPAAPTELRVEVSALTEPFVRILRQQKHGRPSLHFTVSWINETESDIVLLTEKCCITSEDFAWKTIHFANTKPNYLPFLLSMESPERGVVTFTEIHTELPKKSRHDHPICWYSMINPEDMKIGLNRLRYTATTNYRFSHEPVGTVHQSISSGYLEFNYEPEKD